MLRECKSADNNMGNNLFFTEKLSSSSDGWQMLWQQYKFPKGALKISLRKTFFQSALKIKGIRYMCLVTCNIK